MILDWDIVQIEGALLEVWLPSVFECLEDCPGAVVRAVVPAGAWIEDKNSGTILLQQALARQMPVHAIESKLTALGKDPGAFRVRLCIGKRQIHQPCLQQDRRVQTKSRNHLIEQVESFRIGDKENKREDDLLDTFCYGIAIALGNNDGF